MTISEIVALASVLISVGMNVALYTHLSTTLREDMREMRTDIGGIRDDIKLLTGKVYEPMAREH